VTDLKVTQATFYARYGLAPHRQKEARDALGVKLASKTVDGRRQKVYTSFAQIDKVLSHFSMKRFMTGQSEVVVKVIRTNPR
jgi:hypothetical protein